MRGGGDNSVRLLLVHGLEGQWGYAVVGRVEDSVEGCFTYETEDEGEEVGLAGSVSSFVELVIHTMSSGVAGLMV